MDVKWDWHRQPRQAGDASLQNRPLNQDLKPRVDLSKGDRRREYERGLERMGCGKGRRKEKKSRGKTMGLIAAE